MDLGPTLSRYRIPVLGDCGVFGHRLPLMYWDVGLKRAVCPSCAWHLCNAHHYLRRTGLRQHDPCELPDSETYI
jgi:hypothetical protein